MNQAANQVLRHITGQKSLDSTSIEELQKLTDEHPYFPIAHFLLAKKLHRESAEAFTTQAPKAALYFANPLWLDYQLTKEKFSDLVFDEEEVKQHQEELAQVIDVPAEELVAASELAHVTLVDTNTSEDTSTFHDTANDSLQFENKPVEVETSDIETAITQSSVSPLIEDKENNEPTPTITPVIATDPIEVVTEIREEMAGTTLAVDPETEKFLEEAINKKEEPEVVIAEPETIDEPKQEEAKEPAEEIDVHEKMYQSIKAMLDASSDEADADVENAEIPMDPFYTIDYFASQGIKLEFEANPQDKLGQNLKKFTQWLKHMKKLGPEDSKEDIPAGETEADIQQIADSSNTAKEVVTEAMASVLEKQGKKAKAIELYNKLSFLYPHKSAYFADKIKNLKGF